MKRLFNICILIFTIHCLAAQNTSGTAGPSDATSLEDMMEQVDMLFSEGKYAEAADISRAALKRLEQTVGKNNADYGGWQANLAVMLQHEGSLNEALPYLEAGTENARRYLGEDEPDYLLRLSNLGMLYKDLGRNGEAIQALEIAVSTGRDMILPDDTATFGILVNNLGVVYEIAGRSDRALELYTEALDLTEKSLGKENVKYALRLHNIASIQAKKKSYRYGLELEEQALKIFEKRVGRNHPYYLTSFRLMGNMYAGMGDYEKALHIGLEVELLMRPARSVDYPRIWIDIGAAYVGLRRYDKAQEAFTEADSAAAQIFGKTEYWPGVHFLYANRAQAYDRVGQVTEAASWYERLIRNQLRKIDNNFDRYSEAEQESALQLGIYEVNQLFSFSLNHGDILTPMDYDMMLALKGLALGHRRQLLESLSQSADPQTAAAFGEWKQLNTDLGKQYAKSSAKRAPEFAAMQERSDILERQLSAGSATFREARRRTSWQAVQQALQADEAAIEFYHFKYYKPGEKEATDSVLYVAVIVRKNDPAPRLVYLFDEKQLGSLQAVRDLYAPSGQTGAPALQALIWSPLAQYLPGIKTIYYAPSGLLHRVNLGAIPIDEQETLSDRFKLFDLGSTRQLVFSAETPAYDDPTAAVFGGIEYQTESKHAATRTPQKDEAISSRASAGLQNGYRSIRYNDWPYLQWTSREADDIKVLLKKARMQVDLRKGRNASEERFKQFGRSGPSPRVLHLATHGYFFPDADTSASSGFQASLHPLIRSGLILAGANGAWKGEAAASGREDGILTAYEIAQMNLRNTELVVLSACDTGLGELKGNEGVYGLQRAFKMAGAKYILMSLWKVSDEATYQFMTAFYREWLEHGQDIPGAFQSAQQQMKARYDKPSNPFLWAGFVLVR